MKRFFPAAPLMLVCCLALGQTTLHLKSMSPERTAETRAVNSAPKRRALIRSHLLIQYADAPTVDQLGQLQERDIAVLGYIPDFGLAISTDDGTPLADLGLKWYGRLEAAEKLSAEFGGLIGADGAGFFVVEFYPDVN